MIIIILLCLTGIFLYVYKIHSLNYQWVNYREFRPSGGNLPAMSVIIAFRNEVDHLEALLKAIKKQAYPDDHYEVILVDDYSEDGSDIIVQHFCEQNRNFRYISNMGKDPGKKSAIKTGIDAAIHELIITTDADCIMTEKWLYTVGRFYIEKQPDVVIGLVDMGQGTGIFQQYQETEFISLIASGAGAAASGHPIYCNAANFAFRKSVFREMNDPLQESIVSGDDTFFLHNAKKKGKSILLLKSIDAMVNTPCINSWYMYVNQRIRWASKGKYYGDSDTIYLALLVLITNVILVFSFAALILGYSWWLFPLVFMLKISVDFAFLKEFRRFYAKSLPVFRFILSSLIYPVSVIFFAGAGIFIGYTWKGRTYKANA
jgi:biofilm PGA synthesis N-glycosyltransferase PgaC